MEEIIKASWPLIQHYGAASFKSPERSPLLPALSAKDIPGGCTQILNVRQVRRINHHGVESDNISTPELISDTENWVTWTGDLDNPNDSEDDCAVDNESDIENNNGIEDQECPDRQDVNAAPNDPRLVQPIWKSKTQVETVFGDGQCSRKD
jgi:hypothetical protein